MQDGLLPLYEQVRRRILSDIAAGGFAADGFLPPEPELCAAYGVSRVTLRRAVGDLCTEGVLVRQQGRGTLVVPRKLQQTISLSGFSDTIEGLGRRAGHRVLQRDDAADAPDVATELSATRLVRFDRLLEVDGHPMTRETLWFDAARYPAVIAPVAAGGSFFAGLRDSYAITPAGALRHIDVGFARPQDCGLLRVSATQPVYHIRKTVYAAGDLPLAVSHLVTPCHLASFSIRT